MKTAARALVAAILWSNVVVAQSFDAGVQQLLGHPKFKAAQEFVSTDYDRLVRETIQLTEVEAPPFKEQKRAAAYMSMLRQAGLSNVEMDAEGNVMGLRKGSGQVSAQAAPLIAIAAHLDTVFPEGTEVKVKREGSLLKAPGIGDNGRSLAVLLAMIRGFDAAQIQTRSDILFVGNVGEEGPGDLRGMKYLFQKGPYKGRIKMFISIDGAGPGFSITNGALGSKRYRVTFKGPGGHSYGNFGIVNPAYAMAKAMERLSKLDVPSNPRTTFSVGVLGGGTSVNSIPFDAWMEVDLRSESSQELEKLAEKFIRLMNDSAQEENRTRSASQGKIDVEIKLMGDRPSGVTPTESPIVQSASAIIRAFGMQPSYDISSTDANIPISMKIPAITLDSGARGGRAHALDEWIDIDQASSLKGINVVMAVLLFLAGIQ
jgi:tripeptide aminopeptidase